MMAGAGLGAVRAVNVCVWAKALREFRLPLLGWQSRSFARSAIVCPDDPAQVAALRAEGLEVVVAPLPIKPGPRTPLEMARLWRFLLQERFDVLIAHQPMAALLAVPAAVAAGVPVRIYATGGLKHVPGDRGLANRLAWLGERRVIAACDLTLLVNREDERWLAGLPGLGARAHWVGPRGGCGIDLRRFHPGFRLARRGEARRALGAEGLKLVGYAGRLVREKGLDDLAEAVSRLAARPGGEPVELVILGEGLDEARIRRDVAARGLGDRCRFLGYRFDVELWLSALDVFVLPSRREGMPVALLEAMALGLPCIASDVRGSREAIEPERSGILVAPGDPAGLAAAIARLLDDRPWAEALGEQAARSVAERFSERALLARTEELIARTILGRLGGGGPAG